ncbi:hypothetical protein [Paracidovorax cattleyae]|uniref:hypothetical protein n=1 Tax=Paracidovorax cattleyae TaxID=80868 RepID=UPI001A178730|nr:hypothetical protein [Paracidovorax cattleyae]MBF9265038.1 hypothetical protein [Paracidovorax cattleyae]
MKFCNRFSQLIQLGHAQNPASLHSFGMHRRPAGNRAFAGLRRGEGTRRRERWLPAVLMLSGALLLVAS